MRTVGASALPVGADAEHTGRARASALEREMEELSARGRARALLRRGTELCGAHAGVSSAGGLPTMAC